MFHRYRIWAIESFPSFSLLESWSKISPRAMRFQRKMKMKEENFEPRSDERKECYRSPKKRKRQLVRWLMPVLRDDRTVSSFLYRGDRNPFLSSFSFIIFPFLDLIFRKLSSIEDRKWNFKTTSRWDQWKEKVKENSFVFSISFQSFLMSCWGRSLCDDIKIIWLKEIRRQMVSL